MNKQKNINENEAIKYYSFYKTGKNLLLDTFICDFQSKDSFDVVSQCFNILELKYKNKNDIEILETDFMHLFRKKSLKSINAKPSFVLIENCF